MLDIGKACGLNMVEEAYHNYMNHYDCFFLISDYQTQYVEFCNTLLEKGLVTADSEGALTLVDMTIDEAFKKWPDFVYKEPEWPDPPNNASDTTIAWP